MPDFRMQQNSFPIASVIDAAQRNNQLQEQARQANQKLMLESIQGIGQVSKSLFDQKVKVAQALAGAHMYANTPEGKRMLGPTETPTPGYGAPVQSGTQGPAGPTTSVPSPVDIRTVATAMQGMSPQDMFQQQVQSRLARTQEKELAFKEKYKPQELAIQEADLKAKREQESVDQMIRNMLAKAQIQNQEQQRTQAEKNLALEANKETAKHWLSHPLNARKAAKAIAATGQEAALSFATESDAKSANVPKGTIVMIGGRRARID
jgi:hypothetical protein